MYLKGGAVMGQEEVIMNYEQTVMQIIINGGDARASALKAIRAARQGDMEAVDNLMNNAKKALRKAHEIQTNLIQAEARGEKTEVTLLMVHAQDHLMNAMTVKDLAEALIEEIKVRLVIEAKLKEDKSQTKKIILACSGGFSTSMLMERMKVAAKKRGISVDIDAIAENSIGKIINHVDLIMLGPQMDHAEEGLREEYGDRVPIVTINMVDYGMMNGEKVLNSALELINVKIEKS